MTATANDAADLIPRYVRNGLRVLPLHAPVNGRCSCGRACPTPAKHPRLAHGAKDASADIGQVSEWLARWPGDTTNWGVVPPDGVIVVDVDPRNGGFESLAVLEQRYTRLPSTLRARTGSGGAHLWFTLSGPVRGKLAPGVDIKTSTGYLVAPPSRHMSGGRYYWANTSPAAQAPWWLRRKLAPIAPRTEYRGDPGGSMKALVAFVLNSQPGERNNRLFWAAARAVEQGHDPDLLIDAAESIGLSSMEAHATVRSASRAPARCAR